jgi:hypothetical protein
MKAFLLGVSLGLAVITAPPTGCSLQKPVTAPIPNQTSTLDGQVFRVLMDVQAVIDTYKARVANGTLHPVPTLIPKMSALIQGYDDARSTWMIYHEATVSGTNPPTAEMQAKFDQLNQEYAAALSSGAPLPPSGGQK